MGDMVRSSPSCHSERSEDVAKNPIIEHRKRSAHSFSITVILSEGEESHGSQL
jgi:hypothetical protein